MKNSENDIVITGMSLVNCLGSTLSEVWSNLLLNKNACGPISNYNPEDYPSIKDVKYGYEFNLTDEMRILAQNDYMKSNLFGKLTTASIYTYKNALDDSGIIASSNRGAVLFSTLYSEAFEKLERAKFISGNSILTKYNPKLSIIEEYDFIPGLICGIYGLIGINATILSACASTLVSIDYAKKLLMDNDVDFVIVGGGDINVNPFSINKYVMARAHPNIINNSTMCRPLDKIRYGMVVGDGAGAIVLEKRSHAEARHAKIIAKVSSIGLASDDYHPTKPSELGIGITRAVNLSLFKSELKSSDIDYINAHATGTSIGDEVEFNTLNKIFPGKIANSFKGYIGHLTAAAGIVEIIMSILSMNNSMVIKSLNADNPLTGDLTICTENKKMKINHILKTAYGFGGKCASIILSNEQ